MRKTIVIFSIIVLVGIGGVIGLLYTRIWNPSWNPFRPEPEVVLSEMALKMKEVDAFHTEGDFELERKDDPYISSNITLDVDRSQSKSSNIRGFVKVPVYLAKIEFKKLDGDLYFQPGTYHVYFEELLESLARTMGKELGKEPGWLKNKWIKVNQDSLKELARIFSSEYPRDKIVIKEWPQEKQQEFIQEIVELFVKRDFYEVEKELPDKEVGDQRFYRYLVSLNKNEIKDLASDLAITSLEHSPVMIEDWTEDPDFAQELNESIQEGLEEWFKTFGGLNFELWVSQKDYYLYRIKFEKEDVGEDGIESLVMDIKFSEFDRVPKIEPPSESEDMGEIIRMLKESPHSYKYEDSRIISSMSQIRAAAELVYSEEGSYSALSCKYDSVMADLCDTIDEDCFSGNPPCRGDDKPGGAQEIVFNISPEGDKYVAYTPLNTPYHGNIGYYCIDSRGKTGKTSNLPSGFTCPWLQVE